MSPNSLSLSGLDSPPPGTIVWWKLSFWGSAEDICSVAITWLMISQGIFSHQIFKYWTLTELNFCIDFCLCFEKHVLFVCLFVWLYIVESYFGGGTSAVLPLTPATQSATSTLQFWFRMKVLPQSATPTLTDWLGNASDLEWRNISLSANKW